MTTSADQPIVFAIDRPKSFQRSHILLRLALLSIVGWITHPLGLVWLAVPAAAAALIARKDGRRYLDEDGPTVVAGIHVLIDLIAYLALLSDRLPGQGRHVVGFAVTRSGVPTPESALSRILFAIPKLIWLAILTCVGSVVWMIALAGVLISGSYPEGLWRFLRDIVRREACMFVYLASLVERYPDAEPAPQVPHYDAEPA